MRTATNTHRSHRVRGRTVAATALGVALVAAGTGVAAAGTGKAAAGARGAVAGQTADRHSAGRLVRRGLIPMRPPSGQVRPAAAGDLEYHGGPVQASPAVYLVFWGRQWNSDSNGVQSYLTSYFQGLGQSDDQWSPVTSQYSGQNGSPSFNGSVVRGVWVDSGANAPANASGDDVAAEAQRGLSHFGAGADINSSVMVFSPHGTHPDGFPNGGWCAWHSISNGEPFTNEPYVLDAGGSCGAGSVQGDLDGFSITAGHEFLETVTNPDTESGWYDADGQENGDKCAWQNLHTLDLSTGSFAVQPTWSNDIHGCAG